MWWDGWTTTVVTIHTTGKRGAASWAAIHAVMHGNFMMAVLVKPPRSADRVTIMRVILMGICVRPVVTAIGVIGAAAVYPAAAVPKHEHALLQIMVKTTVAVQVKVEVVTLNPVAMPTVGRLRWIRVLHGKVGVKKEK